VAPKATSRNGAPEVKVDPVAEFRAHHHLTAIMKGGRTSAGLAIVDGKTLRPGQALDGLKLVSIREHSATFGADDVRVELSIETPTQLAGIERVSGKR
jgi:hypothetical protein